MNSIKLPNYTAVIRTLGTAGDKYQRLLDSLVHQTHKPKKIVIYLAEGYPKPKETVGIEEVVYVKKGMVAQRAIPYNEVETKWMLMLDDDIAIEPDGVERIFSDTLESGADACAIDGFPHNMISLNQKIVMSILLTSIPRIGQKNKGYTVNLIGSDVYNLNPTKRYAWSTTNSGNAILCRKSDFLNIHFEDDLWLDDAPYAIPEDKVMFYKMHLNGLKAITHYKSGFTHLDAGTSVTSSDRAAKIEYSMARNNRIFYKLYIWPNLNSLQKIFALLLKSYQRVALGLYRIISQGTLYRSDRKRGLKDAQLYLDNFNK